MYLPSLAGGSWQVALALWSELPQRNLRPDVVTATWMWRFGLMGWKGPCMYTVTYIIYIYMPSINNMHIHVHCYMDPGVH